jgi:MscS family membrane protein
MANLNGRNRLDQSLGIFGLAVLVALTSIAAPGAVMGQILPESAGPSEESQDQPPPPPSQPPAERASPRATMATFLEAVSERSWERAIATLNLPREEYGADVLAIRGRDRSAELKAVIDRVAFVELEAVPEDMGDRRRYVWETVAGHPIALERVGQGEWLFARDTLDQLPELWEAVKDRDVVEGALAAPQTPALWLRSQVPAGLREGGFLLEYWQWLGLAILIFTGLLLERTLTFVLVRIVAGQLVRRWKSQRIEDELIAVAMRPLGVLAMAALWWLGLLLLGLPAQALAILLLAVKFLAIASFVWAAYRLVDVGASLLESYAAETETRYDDLLIPLLRTSAKILIGAFGTLFLADNLNINITGLLAGVGLGGIAFALAAQDTVKNFFGSVTVLMDRPFQVGDWVVIGNIEGTVETVGFRSTRIRTFYNSLVTLPNANLISADVDNYGARRYRRWKAYLGVAYDTPPEKVDVLCEGIRELVRQHPYTRKDYFHVYLNQYGPSSLDILLYIFWETPDWATELRERHRLAVDILRVCHHLGVEIAYPTQTLHLKRAGETQAEAIDEAFTTAVRNGADRVREDVRSMVQAALAGTVPPPVDFATDRRDGEASEGSG